MAFRNRISAFIMSLLILISGNGWAISVHKCGHDHKTETNLFSRSSGCCSDQIPVTCGNSPEQEIKSDCCQLKVDYYKSQIPSTGSISQPTVVITSITLFTDGSLFYLHFLSVHNLLTHSISPHPEKLYTLFSIYRI